MLILTDLESHFHFVLFTVKAAPAGCGFCLSAVQMPSGTAWHFASMTLEISSRASKGGRTRFLRGVALA